MVVSKEPLYLWGGIRGGPINPLTFKTLIYMMTTILLMLVLLVIMAIGVGIYMADEIEYGIELSTFKWSSFEIGVTNRNYTWDGGDEEQELRIGLLLFSFIFLFRRFDA